MLLSQTEGDAISILFDRMSKTVVHESEHLRVIYFACPSDVLFITFNEKGMTASDLRFWGDVFFERQQFSAVGIVSKRPNWYPYNDMVDASKKIVPITETYGDVVTYGHSQGGYGALKFSRLFNARTSISFCPQYSIDPAKVGDFDRRFASYFKPELENGKSIETHELCERNLVVFDPLQPEDTANARLIQAVGAGKITRTLVPFTAHSTVRLLTETGAVRKFLDGAIEGRDGLRALIRPVRKFSGTYLLERAVYLSEKGRFPEAIAEGLLAPSQGPTQTLRKCIILRNLIKHDLADIGISCLESWLPELNVEDEFQRGVLVSFGQLLCSRGEYNRAATISHRLRTILFASGKSAGIHEWQLYNVLGDTEAALEVARKFPRTFRDNAFVRLHLVASLIDFGATDEAAAELSAICRLESASLPKCKRFIDRFQTLLSNPTDRQPS
jgi:hypothetical protein